MNGRWKIIAFAWLVLIAGYICFKGVLPGWNNLSTDFNNYYAAAKLLVEGHEIHSFYDNAAFNEMAQQTGVESGAKFSPFPPPTAILYLPLSFWDLLTAKRIWLVLNLLILFLIPFRLSYHFNTPVLRNAIWISLFFVPISSNLDFGQAYLFFAWILIEAVGQVQKDRTNLGAVLVGFSAVLKYFPLLYVGYLFQKKNWPWPLFVLLSIIGITGIFFMIDPEAYTQYYQALTGHVQGNLSGQGKFAIGFQSLDSLLNNLFVFDPTENPSPLIAKSSLKPLFKGLIFIGIGLACLHIFKKDHYRFNSVNVSIFSFAAFTLIPASASYHFLLLIVPAVFLAEWLLITGSKRQLFLFIGLLVSAFFIQYHHIPAIKHFPTIDLLLHYPRLWALFILFSYLYYNRIKIHNG